ncbi:MAG: N-acetylmuramic acid 6-phosphate etherase [Candidatus Zixiibacteriota bacterium]
MRRHSKKGKAVFEEIKDLVTESYNPRTRLIDRLSTREILEVISGEDSKVPEVVRGQLPYIGKAVELIVEALRGGGRLIYFGAGTSGRLGVLDAAECPPTFGASPKQIIGVIAGGRKALWRAIEGAEDDVDAAMSEVKRLRIDSRDVVVGITASRRTPFVLTVLEQSRRLGAKTVFLTCNPRSTVKIKVDVAICPVVGAEVVSGSTRMKAALAQKMILNMLTTSAMIKLGKVYRNLMVDLQIKSEKLKERSKRTIMEVTGVSYRKASNLLKRSGGSVKLAILRHHLGVDSSEAKRLLKESDELLYRALGERDQA